MCTIAHGCVRLERVDDGFFKRYTHGFGDFQELLNRTLHTEGIRWYVYVPAKRRLNEISILLLFVYEYLEDGGHIVIYDQCGVVQFHPEVPVASVDVTLKGEGHTPIDLAWLRRDVMYHFHRSGPYAFRHDTGLLMRMGADEPCFKPSYAGFRVSGRMTVGELASVAGNSIGMLSVHDYDRAMEARAANCDPDADKMISVRFEPIEVVMTDDARRNASEREYGGPIADRLETSEEEVVMYALYSAGSQCPESLCFGDGSTPVPDDMFAIAAFIKKPVGGFRSEPLQPLPDGALDLLDLRLVASAEDAHGAAGPFRALPRPLRRTAPLDERDYPIPDGRDAGDGQCRADEDEHGGEEPILRRWRQVPVADRGDRVHREVERVEHPPALEPGERRRPCDEDDRERRQRVNDGEVVFVHPSPPGPRGPPNPCRFPSPPPICRGPPGSSCASPRPLPRASRGVWCGCPVSSRPRLRGLRLSPLCRRASRRSRSPCRAPPAG